MREDLYIQAEGCNLKTTIMHNENAKAVVLNLHGGPGSGSEVLAVDFSFQLLSRYYTMVYYDQRGSGISIYDLNKGITKEQIVEDLHTVVSYLHKRFPNRPLYLWGGSFGSYLAMMYLQKYPKEVEKVIINSPLLYPSSAYTRNMTFSVMMQATKHAFSGEMGKHYIEECTDPDGMEKFMSRPEVRKFMFSFEFPPRWMEGFWHWAAMLPWFGKEDIRPLIKNLQIPALFVQGMDDPFCSADHNLTAIKEANNPNVSVYTLSPCGHATFEDQPIGFCKSYVNFFGNAVWSDEYI